MTRAHALALATAAFDDGRFAGILADRVAYATESQDPSRAQVLVAYLKEQMAPALAAMGFAWRLVDNPVSPAHPFLLATRREPGAAYTVLSYGHGDVVGGQDAQWRAGLAPWELTIDGDRWFGRGTADNKGQHSVNLLALQQALIAREGRLGYDVVLVLEMGEEVGSPGLREVCVQLRDELRADLFIASDGPRVSAERPTLFLGSRGGVNFDLRVAARPGSYHSGNWGGLLSNPGIRLAHAIASLVDAKGRITARSLVPRELPQNVRDALQDITVGGGAGDPQIDTGWGEPGLTPAERLVGWNSLEVLAFKTGNPESPVNAIPGHAQATCQIRYVVGSDSENFLAHVRAHLATHGFTDVEVQKRGEPMEATRLDPASPWVQLALDSIASSSGKRPALLPNIGGSLPNDIFARDLGLPTLWVPHSFPACAQHAPNEHMLGSVARESLQVMAGLFWDLGEAAAREAHASHRASRAEAVAA
jgi:acetylornithine deacetylase/succinyl-diaminopimelate desuccinylase-like protein